MFFHTSSKSPKQISQSRHCGQEGGQPGRMAVKKEAVEKRGGEAGHQQQRAGVQRRAGDESRGQGSCRSAGAGPLPRQRARAGSHSAPSLGLPQRAQRAQRGQRGQKRCLPGAVWWRVCSVGTADQRGPHRRVPGSSNEPRLGKPALCVAELCSWGLHHAGCIDSYAQLVHHWLGSPN